MIAPIIKGLLLGIILSISVGPVIIAILKQSLTNGKSAGYAFVSGVSASDITLLIVCNVFTQLFDVVLAHKTIIAVVGAAFLFAMGVHTLYFKKISLDNLNEENKKQVWIPPGFAHGFVALSDITEFEYKCTEYYDPEDEGAILWSDPVLNISWPITEPILSARDASAPLLKDVKL